MNPLRVLLVENDPRISERIARRLEEASHAVWPTGGLDQAWQALEVQRFDAVILTLQAVNRDLLPFCDNLKRIESSRKAAARIPVLCYSALASRMPTTAELSQYEVDACLSADFEASAFTQLVSSLASNFPVDRAGDSEENTELLPVLSENDFLEQVGFDQDLASEIIDLFLTDSQMQLQSMREALKSGELLVLSRVAHSIKGSLGSLYAKQSAYRAQVLEQVAAARDLDKSAEALALLEADLEALKPELLALRSAGSSS